DILPSRSVSRGRKVTSHASFDAASAIWPEFGYVMYSTGTPSCAAICLPRSTGTPTYAPDSVLFDQNGPPAALMPIATRNLPARAIPPFRSPALAGAIIATPSARPAIHNQHRWDISFPRISFPPGLLQPLARILIDRPWR